MQNELFKSFHIQMQTAFPKMYTNDDEYESIGITLCLMPIIQPDLLDTIIKQEFGNEGDFPLFGGIRGTQHRGILPTGETWMYFCCASHTAQRIHFIQTIPDYLSNENSMLNIESVLPGEPYFSGRLVFSHLFHQQFKLYNLIQENQLNLSLGNFIQSNLLLNDLILSPQILQSIEEIKHWQHFFEQKNTNSISFIKRVRYGIKILFYGKSGTGKTQTAAIIGNELNKQVYRIDLSQIVSKYIGETEKNLSKIFEVAEQKKWILFFDEGDALFGKRTSVNSSNDRYANQEVAYLLQRMEDYSGIIILSTNLKENIDAAFLRRFQIITEFPMPDKQQRLEIWKKLLLELDNIKIDLSEKEFEELSKTELSGGAITNVVNFALLKSNFTNSAISYNLLKDGIVRELRKENRLTSL